MPRLGTPSRTRVTYARRARQSKSEISLYLWICILIPPIMFMLFLGSGYVSTQTEQHLIITALVSLGFVWIACFIAHIRAVSRLIWGETKTQRSALANYYMTCPSCGYDCSANPDFTACPECGLTGDANRFREFWTNPKAR